MKHTFLLLSLFTLLSQCDLHAQEFFELKGIPWGMSSDTLLVRINEKEPYTSFDRCFYVIHSSGTLFGCSAGIEYRFFSDKLAQVVFYPDSTLTLGYLNNFRDMIKKVFGKPKTAISVISPLVRADYAKNEQDAAIAEDNYHFLYEWQYLRDKRKTGVNIHLAPNRRFFVGFYDERLTNRMLASCED